MKNIIYIGNINNLFNEDKFNYYYNKMPTYRKNKIDKYMFMKDKCLSLGVGIILNKMFKDNNLELDYNVDINLKPISNSCYYNLSHSEYMVMGIISEYNVGCDIEYKNKELLDVKDYFNHDEIDYINNSSNKIDSFYKLWTLKESFMKCIGLGIKLKLHDFSINSDLVINQNVNKNNYYFNSYNLDNYVYSYCIENNNINFEIREIEF